jgi:hypothetical protein
MVYTESTLQLATEMILQARLKPGREYCRGRVHEVIVELNGRFFDHSVVVELSGRFFNHSVVVELNGSPPLPPANPASGRFFNHSVVVERFSLGFRLTHHRKQNTRFSFDASPKTKSKVFV